MCTIAFRADTGNNRKIVKFTWRFFIEIISKEAIKIAHILKVPFKLKFESIPAKSVICIL